MDTETTDVPRETNVFTRGDLVSFDDGEGTTVYGIVNRIDYDHGYSPGYICGMEVLTEFGGNIWFVGDEIDYGLVDHADKKDVSEEMLEFLNSLLY